MLLLVFYCRKVRGANEIVRSSKLKKHEFTTLPFILGFHCMQR